MTGQSLESWVLRRNVADGLEAPWMFVVARQSRDRPTLT